MFKNGVFENRRNFLLGACAAAGVMAVATGGAEAAFPKSPNGKTLAGVFPIGWTPCTPDNKLDTAAMAKQMEFLNKGRVAGMAWPQNASGWESLTVDEWTAGAEALASVKGRAALVLGVQTKGYNVANSQAYARVAKRLNADGIISIVPPNVSDAEVISYFKALDAAAGLPIMVQAVGDTTVDTLIALSKAVPSIVAIKDEAGDPLENGPQILRRSGGSLEVFSGSGGMHFFPEMELGFTGTCPYVGLADVLQASFDHYQAGRKDQAFQVFGAFLAFNSLPHANDYVLKARGVFAEDAIMRANPASGAPRRRASPITDAQKAEIRKALASYLKPYLIA
ncbi:MAG: dihydrodipicolinate synthase family protein [Alphaproteobacteria bacterium]|nr:dihydrodipicolinate synthase family protein [Alphaproteobacteria bacterium]